MHQSAVQASERRSKDAAETERVTGRLQVSMATEAELQEHLSVKNKQVSSLERQLEDLRRQAAYETEALSQARQQAHISRDETATLLVALCNSRDSATLLQSELVSAQEQAHYAAALCAALTTEQDELRGTVAAQMAKLEYSEPQLAAYSSEIEHLSKALLRSEEELAYLQVESRTASEACEIAIAQRIAADQLHEGEILLAEATVAQLREMATHQLRQLEALSEAKDDIAAESATLQHQMREEVKRLEHSQLSVLMEQQLAAEATSNGLYQQVDDLQQLHRQVRGMAVNTQGLVPR